METLAEAQFAGIDRDAKLQERNIIAAEVKTYKMEIQSIQRIKELENELKEEKKKNELYKTFERELIKEISSVVRFDSQSNGVRFEFK